MLILPLLDREVLEKYEEAGRIASKVREEIARVVKEGMLIIEVCEAAEAAIRRLGGKPAFPCNVSVNEIAAHYTSPPGDERIITYRVKPIVDILGTIRLPKAYIKYSGKKGEVKKVLSKTLFLR